MPHIDEFCRQFLAYYALWIRCNVLTRIFARRRSYLHVHFYSKNAVIGAGDMIFQYATEISAAGGLHLDLD